MVVVAGTVLVAAGEIPSFAAPTITVLVDVALRPV
jgi:hypothetical protein